MEKLKRPYGKIKDGILKSVFLLSSSLTFVQSSSLNSLALELDSNRQLSVSLESHNNMCSYSTFVFLKPVIFAVLECLLDFASAFLLACLELC